MTAQSYFQAERDPTGRAWVGQGSWLDYRGSALRLNGPRGVVLVSPGSSLETAIHDLQILCPPDEPESPDEASSDDPPPRRRWPDSGGFGFGGWFDEGQVVQFGVASAEVAEWFGMSLGEAMAIVGVDAADTSAYRGPYRPKRGHRLNRKQCVRCGGLPTVFVSRRRFASSNLDVTIGAWRRASFAYWTEKAWVCRHHRCDYRELSEGAYGRTPQSIQF